MLGDTCQSCGHNHDSCSCKKTTEDCGCGNPQPNIPCTSSECPEWWDLKCGFWMGSPIPGTPIKKGTKATEIVMFLLQEINTLKARLEAAGIS